MNAERLLAHYKRIADAPDAIPRMRRFVLDLAVRGKLVPQGPSDEPASELLKRITAEKARLIKAGKIKKSEVDLINAQQEPFLVPANWSWTRLGEVGDWGSGSTPVRGNQEFYGGGITWLKSGELNDNEQLIGSEETVTQLAIDKGSFRMNHPGDVLIAMYGATIGKLAILAERAVTNQAVCGCTPFQGVFNRFLFLFLLAQREQFHRASEGGAQPNISKVKIIRTPIPLPPLAEQHRIVVKIDELMALCDRLEVARGSREATRDKLTAASLARLNAPDPETFAADARFALDALSALTARPDQIKHLRQTILSLAVVGKLTSSASTRPFASAELDSVKARKKQLGLRTPKTIRPISPDEHWYGLSNGWAWARWDQITDWITYGFTRPMPHTQDGVPIITGKNVNQGKIIFETADRTPITSYQELNEKDRPKRGDILITKDGSIGRTAIVDTNEPFCINQSVAVLWLRSCHFDRRFLQLALDCPQTQQALLAKTEGVAIKHISIIDLGKMVVPVPPLAEQRRIVEQVDELMALCDRLEASLDSSEDVRHRLLDALLHVALAPGEKRELEAAQ